MNAKQRAGERAAEFVASGMTVGLGTGSTVYWALLRLGEMVRAGLRVRGIPTSRQTERIALEQGIPLTDFSAAQSLDLTIDGADEISDALDLIKGGGGALLREKLVAAASERLVIVADASKRVATLGSFPLPVEVVPFGWEVTARRIRAQGFDPRLRRDAAGHPYLTDNGNYLLDCSGDRIYEPVTLQRALKLLPGVVETGLFVRMTTIVVIGHDDRVEIIERTES